MRAYSEIISENIELDYLKLDNPYDGELLAALFNAPTTIDGYYQAEVQHDMPELAMRKGS